MIKIHPFTEVYQNGIDKLIHDIANEFEAPISTTNKSTQQALDKYWVALHQMEIIGTIGLLKIDSTTCVLKSMFVKKQYRGTGFGTAQLLLHKVYEWCAAEGICYIYLGTMSQFEAAHKFYEKNGFEKINRDMLPSGFIANPIDDIFYKKQIRLQQ